MTLLKRFGSRGQNTVEYLMMLAVIVGVILVIGTMFKPRISSIFNDVMNKVANVIENVGGNR